MIASVSNDSFHLIFTFNTLVDIQIYLFSQLLQFILEENEQKKLHSVPHVSLQKKNLNFCNFIGSLFTICKLKMRLPLSKLASEKPRCPNKTVGGDYLFTTCFAKVVIVLIANSLCILFFCKQKVNQYNAGRNTNFRKYNRCLCLQHTVMFHIQ